MKEQPAPPKVPLEESVAGEEDPGASLDLPEVPAKAPQPPPEITSRPDEKPGGG
jgi:hypothetical protein